MTEADVHDAVDEVGVYRQLTGEGRGGRRLRILIPISDVTFCHWKNISPVGAMDVVKIVIGGGSGWRQVGGRHVDADYILVVGGDGDLGVGSSQVYIGEGG